MEIENIPIRNRSHEEIKKYHREYKQRVRLKNKRCSRHRAQATVKDLLTQEPLCDLCDKERLVNKYRKKEEPKNESK